MSENIAIKISALQKIFRRVQKKGLLGELLRNKKDSFRTAIQDIDISIEKGEVVGIIGGNGSGKTTLLKLLAGIYQKSDGVIDIDGSVLYISGFGGLINRNLSVAENIRLLGSVIGISRKTSLETMRDIITDAELVGYENAHASTLSDGMVSRLAFFSMIRHVRDRRPDILLLDEVLSAGGDERFKDAAMSKVRAMAESGATVLIVSHSLQTIQELCQRVIWLENGKIRMDGAPTDMIRKYREEAQKNAV